ncbi:MAG: hypothetical protein DMF79_08260 [Acidobacteria bacterium]|nr:MAG: hypothetical protein DMF79_08260 [Acidobacteriota bacterium]
MDRPARFQTVRRVARGIRTAWSLLNGWSARRSKGSDSPRALMIQALDRSELALDDDSSYAGMEAHQVRAALLVTNTGREDVYVVRPEIYHRGFFRPRNLEPLVATVAPGRAAPLALRSLIRVRRGPPVAIELFATVLGSIVPEGKPLVLDLALVDHFCRRHWLRGVRFEPMPHEQGSISSVSNL